MKIEKNPQFSYKNLRLSVSLSPTTKEVGWRFFRMKLFCNQSSLALGSSTNELGKRSKSSAVKTLLQQSHLNNSYFPISTSCASPGPNRRHCGAHTKQQYLTTPGTSTSTALHHTDQTVLSHSIGQPGLFKSIENNNKVIVISNCQGVTIN